MSKTRLRTSTGKRSYLLAPFDDGVQWNQYWTTTYCNSVNFISDKYGKKYCQEGESSVWFELQIRSNWLEFQKINQPDLACKRYAGR
jgi:hypothetical protein